MKSRDESIAICVSGAPGPGTVCPPAALDVAQTLGQACVRHGCDIMTTTTSGFPLWVAMAAQRKKGTVIAFSGAASRYEHENVYDLPTEGFTSIVYTGFGTSGASILALRSSDAIIFGCGGMTSILECVTAIEEGKPIGILEGDWELDDALMELLEEEYPEYDRVIIDADPKQLVERVIQQVSVLRADE